MIKQGEFNTDRGAALDEAFLAENEQQVTPASAEWSLPTRQGP